MHAYTIILFLYFLLSLSFSLSLYHPNYFIDHWLLYIYTNIMYICIYIHTHKHHAKWPIKCILFIRTYNRIGFSYKAISISSCIRKCNRLRSDRSYTCATHICPMMRNVHPPRHLIFTVFHIDPLALASFPRVDRSAIRLLIARRVVDWNFIN